MCMLFFSVGGICIGHFHFKQIELSDLLQVELRYPNQLAIYSGRE